METSSSLLDRLPQDPDEGAWRRLDDLYRPFIRRLLRRDPTLGEDAEDITQDVMSVLVRDLRRFRRQRAGSFRCWLREITARRLRAHYRQRRRQPAAGGGLLETLRDPHSELSRRWDEEYDRHLLTRLLELIEPQFTPRRMAAFRSTVFDGAPVAQVAAELGMSANAVVLAKSRILRRLRQEAGALLG